MQRLLWAPLVALVVSCHTPTEAQNRATVDPAASVKSAALAEDVTLASQSPQSRQSRRTTPKPREATEPPPLDVDPVGLCCDVPSGLCYPDDGALCLTATSRMISCPAVAVREITNGFVVCAD